MARHEVTVSIPADREVKNDPVVLNVMADGEQAGQLWVSRGGLCWWPSHAKQPIEFTWEQFARAVETSS